MRAILASRCPLVLGVALSLAACDRRTPAPPADSATAPVPTVAPESTPAAPLLVSGWDRDAGAALLVAGEDGEALVVVPGEPGTEGGDRTAGRAADVLPAEVALFTRAGAAGHARATPSEAPGSCNWPTARLGPVSGGDALPAWTVGFVGGTPASLALDSIEGSAARDSAALAATVTRLVAALEDDTVRTLRGVPFTVRSARRFTFGDGREGLVAIVTRALNQEASPVAEQVLLVAERGRGSGTEGTPSTTPAGAANSTPWMVAYHERDAGSADAVLATDVLSAVAIGPDARPTLVLARALADGSRYGLLERTGDLAWRLRWTSAVRRC